ncbi:glycosyltransferase [Phocaeicola barnesiae]|uniref:glycosyltransferase n=1 Tax=Phocaeicola barnesiae TaxID=376804 RepID=UPI001F247840|nr:glycosyltransferase [Phocaeicola barnesiae]MCF2575972.1 glycosyltransferase [Phocaeicola barnesiae]
MKVIHYIPTIDRNWGGTTAYMQLLANELGKLTELHIFTHASENPVEIQNCQIHNLPSWKHPVAMKREFTRLLNQIQPDMFHVNGCWTPGCALTQKWAQEMGIKVVLTPHGMLEPWILARHYWTRKVPALLLYQKAAVKKADYLHATADSEKENLLKLGYNPRIEVIPNGIEVDNISVKKNWERKKRILFLSRIHIKKGIEFLLEAVALLKDKLEGYVIEIAGEGEQEYIARLKQKAKELQIESLVQFCGGVYGDQKWKLFQAADVFVLPTFSENFGIVVAEALACGTPVITTQGTPWQELETAHCGWWTETGTQPTADALNKFLQLSVKELERMGRNGRRLVEQKYSSRKMAEDMVELYQKVCKQK